MADHQHEPRSCIRRPSGEVLQCRGMRSVAWSPAGSTRSGHPQPALRHRRLPLMEHALPETDGGGGRPSTGTTPCSRSTTPVSCWTRSRAGSSSTTERRRPRSSRSSRRRRRRRGARARDGRRPPLALRRQTKSRAQTFESSRAPSGPLPLNDRRRASARSGRVVVGPEHRRRWRANERRRGGHRRDVRRRSFGAAGRRTARHAQMRPRRSSR